MTLGAGAPQEASILSSPVATKTLKIEIQADTTPIEYQQVVEFWSSLPGVITMEEDITAYEEKSSGILPDDPLINSYFSNSAIQYTHLWPMKKPSTNVNFYGMNLPPA